MKFEGMDWIGIAMEHRMIIILCQVNPLTLIADLMDTVDLYRLIFRAHAEE
jgi:hypothetical protein